MPEISLTNSHYEFERITNQHIDTVCDPRRVSVLTLKREPKATAGECTLFEPEPNANSQLRKISVPYGRGSQLEQASASDT